MASTMRFDRWEDTTAAKSVTIDQISGGSGLVPIIPTSVTLGSGTSSINSSGMVTFSGASYVTLNNVFVSPYTRYRILINNYGTASGTSYNLIRMVSVSGDVTGPYYESGHINYYTSAAAGNYSINNGSSWDWAPGYPGGYSGTVIDLFDPNVTTGTKLFSNATQAAGNSIRVNGLLDTAASYPSIKFYQADNANINGTITVYGYR